MKNYLVLKFNDDYRMESMLLHSKVDKHPIKDARISYIAGWICIDGNTQLTKISEDVVEFKIANTKYSVRRMFLDDVNFEELK